MKSSVIALAAAGTAYAEVAAYGRCGGNDYSGETDCASGFQCHNFNEWYSQCIKAADVPSDNAGDANTQGNDGEEPSAPETTMKEAPASSTSLPPRPSAYDTAGLAETNAPAVEPTSSSSASSTSVYQFVSSTEVAAVSPETAEKPAPVTTSTSMPTKEAAASPSPKESATKASKASSSGSRDGKVSYAGVNIAGYEFGCSTDGSCSGSSQPPEDGNAQMTHFVEQGLNTFRLPVSWQYLTGSVGGDADLSQYDNIVQGCLDAGAEMCIIDLHNYARVDGQIVGQGGPTDEQFAQLWSQIATKYADSPKVAFGLMNEPHDVDIDTWATTVRAAVTAVRKAGATDNVCLLPGNEWTHATAFVDNGSGAALSAITNPDGSTDNLVFDVHAYLDSDGSGTSTSCSTSNADAFKSLGQWLQKNERKAMLTETGGGPTDESCLSMLCEQHATLNDFADVYLGWVGWAAGSFDPSYEISETPNGSAGSYEDQPLVKQCIIAPFL